MKDGLALRPCSLNTANEFVEAHHRRLGAVVGHKFSIAAQKDDVLVGVVIVGRPNARSLDHGLTLEVTRLCTDGTRNACSFLYAAAWRAVRALGYQRLGTYIAKDESGVSLRAVGWRVVGETTARSWNTPTRPRNDNHPIEPRLRFEAGA